MIRFYFAVLCCLVLCDSLIAQGTGNRPSGPRPAKQVEPIPNNYPEFSSKPNVWFILLDDVDPEGYGFFGNQAVHTPNLDYILSNGCVFPNGHVMPTCRPSLSTLLSGLYPHEHGIKNNMVPFALNPTNCWPIVMRDAEYVTFLGGKFWEGNWGTTPATYGFEITEKAGPGIFSNNLFVRSGQHKFLTVISLATKPFFAFWAPLLPHLPYSAQQEYLDMINTDEIQVPSWVSLADELDYRTSTHLYMANMAWVDHEIGVALDVLRASGRLENTLIITMADNGWGYGHISKQSPYEKGIKTHISFTWLNKIRPSVKNDLVSLVDVPATALSLLEIPAPPSYSGINLSPVILGETNRPVRKIICGDVYSLQPYPGDTDTNTHVATWAKNDRFKYIKFYAHISEFNQTYLKWTVWFVPMPTYTAGTEQLFDLTNDPYERNNIAADSQYAAVLDELRDAAAIWHDRQD